ncbi:glycosyl hydrolase family 16 [Maribacter vaceletii]|uniref:Glycosyl hydrolase family 16 n=1 Tax=Maribacter vaceletii TaxID=1206816 RepID=A0A495E609_9FLAO|nr:glycoside hydrolase family 16 protein [Maribacter vaceletii]RKR12385.1 glycosyl hydrolase family 16 [Maribacter vaceletii]
MKTFIKIMYTFILAIILVACQEEEPNLDVLALPTGLTVMATPSEDGSGEVSFNATASNVINYKFVYDDGTDAEIDADGQLTKRFTKTGLNTYVVTIVAYGMGGVSSSQTIEVEVRSDFSDPEAIQILTGGTSKTWYLAASEPGHLGVGPSREGIDGDWWYAKWYSASPFEKCSSEESDCLCDDELTFSVDTEGQLTYVLDNKGQTYFNGAHEGVAGGSEGMDFCYDFDTSGIKNVSIGPSDGTVPEAETRGTQMTFSDGGFMGYYVGSSSYEILKLTDDSLHVRTYDALNPDLAWYHIFSTSIATEEPEVFESVFTTLVWSDEFDVDGAPNTANWGYDLGAGGWGNNEAQTYTNNAENVVVDGGMLKITAKADGVGGYTSARLKSENLYEFTYGRVEVRAKLPASQGTWPAIWMLGANFDSVGWPSCGEVDIMEQTGQDKTKTSAAVHFPDNSAGEAPTNSIENPTSTTEFHNYAIEWTVDELTILLDGEVFFKQANSDSVPFNLDFFMILNVAMGGTLGGDIDPAFIEDSMEIDYVRVYQ